MGEEGYIKGKGGQGEGVVTEMRRVEAYRGGAAGGAAK